MPGTAAAASVSQPNVGALMAAQTAAKAISSPPSWVSGGPRDSDNRHGRYRGAVGVQFTVGAEGRASNCTVVRPSGNPELDALTCRRLVESGRFTPARDADGQSVTSQAYATYVWGRGHRRH
jgi:protein TonB